MLEEPLRAQQDREGKGYHDYKECRNERQDRKNVLITVS